MAISRIDLISSGLEGSYARDFDNSQLTDFERRILNFRSEWTYLSDVILDRAESADDVNSVALRNTPAHEINRPSAKLLEVVALQDEGLPLRIVKEGEKAVQVIYGKGYIAGSGAPEQENERKAFSTENPYFYLIGIAFGSFSDESPRDIQNHLSSSIEKTGSDAAQGIADNFEWLIDSARMTRYVITRASVEMRCGGGGSESMSIQEDAPDEFEKMLSAGITPLSLEALSGLASRGAAISAENIGIKETIQVRTAEYDYNPFD